MRPNLRSSHLLRFACLWIALGALPSAAFSAASTRPNILFLFADDQCHETIHALGNNEIQTPNLDRLVREGTVFTRAYNMGAWHGAVCVASRTSLNTGRTLWRARTLEPHLDDEVQAGRFWAQLLQRTGYETYMTGKWHIQTDAARVFDHTLHIRPGMPPTVPAAYQRPVAGRPDTWQPWDTSLGGFWEGGEHWSEVLARDADTFLQQSGHSARPFFLYLAFNAPHDPRQSPRAFVDLYPADRLSLPANFLPSYPFMEAIGCGRDLRDERLAPWPRTPQAVKVHRQEYYALITHTDAQIGKILQSLQASGQATNTVIVFTADHGLAVGHHGLFGKQNLYEHSLRPPLILAGPGIPKGRRIDTPVYLQDLMPTTLELAGAPVPAYVEFKSLLPLIRGERTVHYPAIYAAYRENLQRMVLQDDWKLLHYPAIDRYRLFDLNADPDEMHDLAGDPTQRDRLNSLRRTLAQLQREFADPLANPPGQLDAEGGALPTAPAESASPLRGS